MPIFSYKGHDLISWYNLSMIMLISFCMDNMLFYSNIMACYLCDIRLSASLFSVIKFRSGGHSLRVETNR